MKPDCIHLYRALAPHPNRQTGAAIFVVVLMSFVVSLMSIQLVNRLVLGNRDVILEQDVAFARQAA